MGGIVEAYITNFANVTSIAAEGEKVSAITMVNDEKFKRYAFKAGTGQFTSTLNTDPVNGTSYVSTDILLQFNRMETSKRVEMAALAVNELAMIVKDANGKYWYFGKDEPVCASAGDGQTGTARGDANRYTITLQDNSKTFPYEVDETIVAALIA